MNKSTDICWYPLRVTYSRELQLKEVLDAECIENFIPMHYEYVKQGERKIRKLVPVVHNLVFVHSSFACIDRVKQSLGSSLSVRYIIDRETNRPLIVPDSQMHSFIAVSGNYEEQIVYLDPALTSLRKGDRVRIIGGVFEGGGRNCHSCKRRSACFCLHQGHYGCSHCIYSSFSDRAYTRRCL